MRKLVWTVALCAVAVTTSAVAQDGGSIINPEQYWFEEAAGATAGTSGTAGIRTLVLKGDPEADGLYTILLRIPPNTRIAAHAHRDDRVATVVSGDWYIGYGSDARMGRFQQVELGGFYTEPPNAPHYARTGARGAVVMITGVGPTDTRFSTSNR
jgi:quercetin dioxygenase-like cupin family protein